MILIPARNEGPRVADVVLGARSACPGVPVVVVANGCTDDTASRASAAGAEVITSEPGYAAALRSGYRHAMASWSRGDAGPGWLVQLDADGQHPTSAIPRLIAALDACDVAIGSRFVGGGVVRCVPLRRRVAIGALGLWTSVLLRERLWDVTSGFQALRPGVVALLAESEFGDLADANVLIRIRRAGFSIVEIPVEMAARAGGESMHHGLGSVVYGARTAMRALAEAAGR